MVDRMVAAISHSTPTWRKVIVEAAVYILDGAVEKASSAGVFHAEIFLHDSRGATNLGPHHLAVASRGQALVQNFLNRHRIGRVLRPTVHGQVPDGRRWISPTVLNENRGIVEGRIRK